MLHREREGERQREEAEKRDARKEGGRGGCRRSRVVGGSVALAMSAACTGRCDELAAGTREVPVQRRTTGGACRG